MSIEENAEAWLKELEKRRRSIDLHLDREGAWWHDGAPFTHDRLIEAFNRGLDIDIDSGEPILRVGGHWCYISVEDTAFIVLRVSQQKGAFSVLLNTREKIEMDPTSLSFVGETLYTRLGDGRRARFNRDALATIAGWLIEKNEEYFLQTPNGDWPIRLEE